jgi:hypothetical protein
MQICVKVLRTRAGVMRRRGSETVLPTLRLAATQIDLTARDFVRSWLSLVFALFTLLNSPAFPQQSRAPSAEERAVAYLAAEVPGWSRENHCFSCHNNGDAARALYVARSLSYDVSVEALSDTTEWLLRPTAWEDNKGEPGFSDKKLARIQFAAALAEAFRTAAVDARQTLIVAAETLLPDQSEDGSWKVDASGALGSPATYGATLATYMARRTLHTAGAERFRDVISRADEWLLAQTPRATVDAAALALAMADRLSSNEAAKNTAVEKKLGETMVWLLASQAGDGGWGPYPKSPSEAFDTAITLLALTAARDADTGNSTNISESVHRGRGYLIATQLPAGGWPATTRPSGFQSYAQHASTSGWATLALLRTRPESKP